MNRIDWIIQQLKLGHSVRHLSPTEVVELEKRDPPDFNAKEDHETMMWTVWPTDPDNNEKE